MEEAQITIDLVRPAERLLMVVGNYGSGKTEFAVNLALALARSGPEVTIADLDLVNPYFRCREARRVMEAGGVRVVSPPPSMEWADLPIVMPEVLGLLHPRPGSHVIFDVGGDDLGARALASMRCALADEPYELWQVLNTRRPFTSTAEGCLAMRATIERASRLAVTGWILNTHLMEHTTPATILEGYDVAREVARESGLPIRCVAIRRELADAPELASIDPPVLRLNRTMLPPWQPVVPHEGGRRGPHLD